MAMRERLAIALGFLKFTPWQTVPGSDFVSSHREDA